MEYLHNGFTLEISPTGFPLSTDSIALADFVKLPKEACVLDLGSGCGTLGLMLCAKRDDCTVTGVELSQADHEAALQNAEANGLCSRLDSICADIKPIPSVLPNSSFHICVTNPPYYTGGPKSGTHPLARHTDTCNLQDIFQAAGWALQYGGDFFLVHKPEYFGQICHLAAANQLEPKRVRLVRHKENGPISLILLQCRKGAKPGLIWEEAALHRADGTPTAYYKQLYHL